MNGSHRRNEDGVIAIIVALSISTFLLGFAAMAVDLGSAYLRKAELQSIADRLAVAGAAGLPAVDTPDGAINRMNHLLAQICDDNPTPGVCPADGSAPDVTSWLRDPSPATGELTFLDDPDGDGQYSLTDTVTNFLASNPIKATALQLTLPPSTVQFGLASAFGYKSADIHKTATARIGTPLGRGILPFALTPADLAAGQRGQFCVNASGGTPTVVPAAIGPVQLAFATNFPGGVPNSTPDQTMEITLQDPAVTPPTQTSVSNVILHYLDNAAGSTPASLPLTAVPGKPSHWSFPLPAAAPGILATVWVTGTYAGQPFLAGPDVPMSPGIELNHASVIHYTGTAADDGLCNQQASYRGYLSLVRKSAAGDLLEQNIRNSPDVKLFQSGGTGPLDAVSTAFHCASAAFSAQFTPATSCLTTVTPPTSFAESLANGLLQSDDGVPGRLIGDCGNPSTSATSSLGINLASLFDQSTGLLAPGRNGSGTGGFLDRITSAQPPTTGAPPWLTSATLRCPRMAVMPVINPTPIAGLDGNQITGFRYVWIDDTTSPSRGVNAPSPGQVTSFRGYIIPGGYLPALVSGSPEVGPYLGGDMPTEALLIHDLNPSMP